MCNPHVIAFSIHLGHSHQTHHNFIKFVPKIPHFSIVTNFLFNATTSVSSFFSPFHLNIIFSLSNPLTATKHPWHNQPIHGNNTSTANPNPKSSFHFISSTTNQRNQQINSQPSKPIATNSPKINQTLRHNLSQNQPQINNKSATISTKQIKQK